MQRVPGEAIKVMTDMVKDFGYASSGESFSIADKEEVWILEMIGKGDGQKGAVWVALKIPDGYISGHANQARITQFPKDNAKECLYAPDVITLPGKRVGSKVPTVNLVFLIPTHPLNLEVPVFAIPVFGQVSIR